MYTWRCTMHEGAQMRKVVIDIETYDPNIDELGNGAIRKDGYILDAGLYDGKEYYCCRPETPSWQRLIDVMGDPSIIKIAHNGVYDYDWLYNGYGIKINGMMEDTMTRAGLLNEYCSHYNLDACCLRAGLKGKLTSSLQGYWESIGGKGNVMKNLLLIPADKREEYNRQDCELTYQLYEYQQPQLEAKQLIEANQLEADQFPVILEMRKNGIRIDLEYIAKLRKDTEKYVTDKMNQLYLEYGLTSLSERKTPGSLPMVLKRIGADEGMLYTKTGLSVSYDSMLKCKHPIGKTIIELNRKKTMLDKFINGVFVKFPIGDRIHGTFKPTKRDQGGTITGRYSSSEPNMQNFTFMANKGGEYIRGSFIPDDGCWLGRLDFSQIEYRILAHMAVGPGSQALRDMLIAGGDYHGATLKILGWTGPDARRRIKNFNFGVLYGMGLKGFKEMFEYEAAKTASEMGMTTDEYTTHFYNDYMRRMTFIKPTTHAIEAMAARNKGLRSVGGRWHNCPPDGGMYKMTNYLIQGSAADINKMGLRDAYKAGIFEALKLHVTVHDETVVSVPKSKLGLEAVKELQHTMSNCYTDLRVPIKVECGLGKNWFIAGRDPGTRNYSLMAKRLGMAQ